MPGVAKSFTPKFSGQQFEGGENDCPPQITMKVSDFKLSAEQILRAKAAKAITDERIRQHLY